MIGKCNPFNIRFSKGNHWKGQVGNTKGFCDFASIDFGVRAAAYLLVRSYRSKGITTYSKIIERFAPPSENNTASYVEFVCKNLHVFPFDTLSCVSNYVGILRYMAKYETGTDLSGDYVLSIIKYFKLWKESL